MTKHSICRTGIVGSLILAALFGIEPRSASAADPLRFGGYGGALLEVQKSYLGEPFEALTDVKIQWTASTEEVYTNKLTATAGSAPPFDLIMLDEPWYSLVRVRGLAEKLNATRVPNLRNVKKEFLLPDNVGACLFSFTLGIVYNKTKFAELGIPAPSRWQDLANPKLSGHVGTQTMAATAPKHLLAAYAIQFGDPPTKWDRAIDEVAKIKFHSFSSGVADLVAKMEAGEIWAAPMTNGRAQSMIDKGLPVAFILPENGDGTRGGVACTALVLTKGSPNRVSAEKFISFALSPGAQMMQAVSKNPYGPVISALDETLGKAPELGARVPFGDMTKTALRLSWDQEALDKFPQYVDAWNRKIQK